MHGLVDLGKASHFSGPQFSSLETGVLSLSFLLHSSGCPENQHKVMCKTPRNQHEWRLGAQLFHGIRQLLAQILLLLLISEMTLNKLLICPGPQVPQQRKETTPRIFHIGLFWECKAQSLAHGQGSGRVGLFTKLQASTCPRGYCCFSLVPLSVTTDLEITMHLLSLNRLGAPTQAREKRKYTVAQNGAPEKSKMSCGLKATSLQGYF